MEQKLTGCWASLLTNLSKASRRLATNSAFSPLRFSSDEAIFTFVVPTCETFAFHSKYSVFHRFRQAKFAYGGFDFKLDPIFPTKNDACY